MGLKDDETVQDITKKKAKTRVEGDEVSQFTEISGLTQYTSNTAASKERKQLRKQVDEKQAVLEEQEAEIARLKAALEGKVPAQNNPPQAHLSGEDTAESPPSQQEGWEPDPDYDTPPSTVNVHQGQQQNRVIDLSKDADEDSEEEDNYSCKEDYYN